jgi:Glycerol kinase
VHLIGIPKQEGQYFGITRATGINEITTATLESIAFQTRDLIEASAKDGAVIKELRVDGGMVANDWFNKQLSNLLGVKILKPKFLETTALGAAYLAGISSGLVDDFNHLQNSILVDKEISPMEAEKVSLELKYKNWLKAVEAIKLIKSNQEEI